MLCLRYISGSRVDRHLIEQAILGGHLKVHPELQQTDLSEISNLPDTKGALITKHSQKYQVEKRTLITIRADIKTTLRQIVDHERIKAQKIEKNYQQKSVFRKTQAQINSFGKGLYGAGESFLTWMKDFHDVVSVNQRLFRIMKAAAIADSANDGQRYQVFKQTLAESEKKELVEALGFDPSKISLEKFKQAYEMANLIYDDHLTQIILTQFVKDYADAQHSLEWSEFSGGAAFEVALTALIAIATGGVGAIASLGTQVKKISQLKKLGKLFGELAEVLKNIPKGKRITLRKMKEVEDKRGRKTNSASENAVNIEMAESKADAAIPQKERAIPLHDDNTIAKSSGSSVAQVKARKKVAFSFYEDQGMPAHKIEGHLSGIDFEKPVEVVILPKGKVVDQYQVPDGPQGNYYAPKGTPPSALGISSRAKDWNTGELVTKTVTSYETNSRVSVLKSTAAEIEDTWSVPNESIKTDGGGTQFFNMNTESFTPK